MKVVVTTKDFCEEAKRYLESEGFEVALRNRLGIGAGAPDDVLYPVVEDADAIIAGTETYRPELLARLRNLKLICRNGIGYDAINLDALRKEGIGLTRTKGFVEGAVAEQVMAYILYFARRVDLQSADMHDHCWNSRLMPGAKNHTIGLVGFGGIGTEVAKRAVPFGMKVIYFCRHPNPADDAAYGVQSVSMEELLKESDYVVAAVPLTDQTFHLFNEGSDEGRFGSDQYCQRTGSRRRGACSSVGLRTPGRLRGRCFSKRAVHEFGADSICERAADASLCDLNCRKQQGNQFCGGQQPR